MTGDDSLGVCMSSKDIRGNEDPTAEGPVLDSVLGLCGTLWALFLRIRGGAFAPMPWSHASDLWRQ